MNDIYKIKRFSHLCIKEASLQSSILKLETELHKAMLNPATQETDELAEEALLLVRRIGVERSARAEALIELNDLRRVIFKG